MTKLGIFYMSFVRVYPPSLQLSTRSDKEQIFLLPECSLCFGTKTVIQRKCVGYLELKNGALKVDTQRW